MRKSSENGIETISAVSNDAASTIMGPFAARVSVQGTAPFLFHRWSVDGVEAKAKAAKGSKAKKEDDVESYVYRDNQGHLAIPGEYFRMALINAAKYQQDPRSPRKSAMDLFKAGVVVLGELCSFGNEGLGLSRQAAGDDPAQRNYKKSASHERWMGG